MDFETLFRRLWDPVSTPVLLALGALASHLWRRYLNRMAVFRWSVRHNRIAIATTHPNVGNIEVRWNDNVVQNLQFCNVEIENESSRDFTNVDIKFSYADGTYFLGEGTVFGTEQFLPWTARYGEIARRVENTPDKERDAQDANYVLSRREYTIPVFNRGSKIGATFVVRPPEAFHEPSLNAACEHPGARFLQRPQRVMIVGVVQTHAVWIGMIGGAVLVVILTMFIASSWIVALLAFVLGAFGQLIGVAVVRLKRWIVRTVG